MTNAKTSRTRAERTADVRQSYASTDQARRLRDAGASHLRETARRAKERALIAADRNLSPIGQREGLAAHDGETAKLTAAFQSAAAQAIDGVRANILPVSPDFAPVDTVSALRINGIAQAFESYSPDVALRVARDAVMRGDLPLIARLRDSLQSFASWKAPFVGARGVDDVLESMHDALGTPDVCASDAAVQWSNEAENDVRYLLGSIAANNGTLDPSQIEIGALPVLFPGKEVP